MLTAASMLSMLSLADWGSKFPTRVLNEPIQRVNLDWDRLNATKVSDGTEASPYPNPAPAAAGPNPTALTFVPRASVVCPSATSRRILPR